jgi:hypothetical protein
MAIIFLLETTAKTHISGLRTNQRDDRSWSSGPSRYRNPRPSRHRPVHEAMFRRLGNMIRVSSVFEHREATRHGTVGVRSCRKAGLCIACIIRPPDRLIRCGKVDRRRPDGEVRGNG